MDLAWLGFWIFMAVFIICDTWLFSKGYNSFFWTHRTPEEKKLREQQLNKGKDNCNE